MCLRAEEGERLLTSGLEDDARDGVALRHTPREGLPQVQLLQGIRGTKLRQHHRPRLQGDRPLAENGYRRTEFKLSFGKAYLAPVYDFASKEIVAHSISMCPNLASNKRCFRYSWMPNPREPSRFALGYGVAVPARDLHQHAAENGLSRACHVKATVSITVPPSRSRSP